MYLEVTLITNTLNITGMEELLHGLEIMVQETTEILVLVLRTVLVLLHQVEVQVEPVEPEVPVDLVDLVDLVA